jgi:hypothetical protein
VTLLQSVFGMNVSMEGYALQSPFSASADADTSGTEQRCSALESVQDSPAVQHLCRLAYCLICRDRWFLRTTLSCEDSWTRAVVQVLRAVHHCVGR